MSIEILPNEVLIECFEYLDGMDIYYAFDQLNSHFQELIRSLPLYVNFQNVEKRKFDQFCAIISTNSRVKEQIYSLQLSNKSLCQIHLFLSYFPMKQFSNLRSLSLVNATENDLVKFTSDITTFTRLSSFRLIDCQKPIENNFFFVPTLHLQKLTVPNLFRHHQLLWNISSITSLTMTYCCPVDFHEILNQAHALEYLNIYFIHCNYFNQEYVGETTQVIHLKELVISQFGSCLGELLVMLERVSNLTRLTIDVHQENATFKANHWQELITSSLPLLKNFNFRFHFDDYDSINPSNAYKDWKQFQTDYWEIENHWFTEYSSDDYHEEIYTIPYPFDTYGFCGKQSKRICRATNGEHSFDNITDLIIYFDEFIYDKYPYYFPHVTSLSLDKQSWKHVGISFTNKHIETLKTMINFNEIKHLCFTDICTMKTPLILLNMLRQMPNLFSLAIDDPDQIIPLLNNDELCEYLNKMIKRLDIAASYMATKTYSYTSGLYRFHRLNYAENVIDNLYVTNKFWETFSNIEYVKHATRDQDSIVFLMQRFPKLLRMQIWLIKCSLNSVIAYLKEKASKLNIQIATNVDYSGGELSILSIWLIRNS